MRIKKFRYFSCDFETTVYEGQEYTEVWAAVCVELFTEDVKIFHSIHEIFDYIKLINGNVCCYFHNLKFDGSFWLSFLFDQKFEQALNKIGDQDNEVEWQEERYMKNNTFKYSISDRGQWYTITIKQNNRFIELRDSLKLLPFSVKKIGKSFGTKHKKLDMEYKGFRYAGCNITDEEKIYITNDALIPKEALEIMFNEGHDKLTIGSCCLDEYKKIVGDKKRFEKMFPNLYELVPSIETPSKTIGEYIRKSYRGGWCYLVPSKAGKIKKKGTTADVNSLYPSMMHSESGNVYPIGLPTFWEGNYIPPEAVDGHKYYFVRIKTRFYLKKGKLPFIQIKGSWLYKGTESLETSDFKNPDTGEYNPFYTGIDGKMHDTRVVLTMTMTDYILFREQYEVIDFEILDGCYFSGVKGLFDEYINKYREIKVSSKGAKRELAKLFLNNLYGKFAANDDSSFKVAYIKEDGSLGFYPVSEYKKTPGYIPIGSAITSYARNFTIRAAQSNYHGNKPGFIYADTDSIHCDLSPDEINGITVHDTAFCCWKLESCWDTAYFTRQKTYIEHVTHENLKEVEPYYNIKCAGMPDKCKEWFEISLSGVPRLETGEKQEIDKGTIDFLYDEKGQLIKRSYEDFNVGLKVPGKLMPKHIKGGVVLKDVPYEMRNI